MPGTSSAQGSPAPLALTERDRARLDRHVRVAAERARRRHRAVLASVTVEVGAAIDPTAVVVAARRAGEDWFCIEQPERDRAVVTGLGAACRLESSGRGRFADVAASWRALLADTACDAPDGSLAGAGPIAAGGFSFAPDGGSAPEWSGFEPAALHVPVLSLVRRGDRACMTVNLLVSPGEDPAPAVERLCARVAALDPDSRLPALDPDPVGRHRVVSVLPPEHYEEAVARATERIAAGALEKIVLARAVDVHSPTRHHPEAALGALRDGFPGCHLVCVGRGDAVFLAASPELLIRRDGLRAATLALAGSTRRSADPAVDDHLGEQLLRSPKNRAEQAIVTRRIVGALSSHSVWVTAADEPVVAKMANIQHLATPIRAQLARPVGAVELAGLLHPTPAVGGEPWPVAEPLIPALEGLDRGWYAAPVGWTDAAEDGEFVVGLRSALVRGPVARCFAGVGVVADSEPAAELEETEIKLGALQPVLSL